MANKLKVDTRKGIKRIQITSPEMRGIRQLAESLGYKDVWFSVGKTDPTSDDDVYAIRATSGVVDILIGFGSTTFTACLDALGYLGETVH